MFNCGVMVVYKTDNPFREYNCSIYFTDWNTLMDFYIKTVYKNSDVQAVVHHDGEITGKFKVPFLKFTKNTIYHFDSKILGDNNVLINGTIRLLLRIQKQKVYLSVMEKIKEYSNINNFYLLFKNSKSIYKLCIFDGLDDNLKPKFKEIKTEGMF